MKQSYKFFCQCSQIAIVVLLIFSTINTVTAQTTLPAEDIAEKALASTVYLEMKDTNGKTLGIGSGFFVKPNIIATNYHVIEGAAKGTAKLVGKDTTYNIEGVTAIDKDNDLALLKVTAIGIKPLALGDSDAIRLDETIYVAGNQKGLKGAFSHGIIDSRYRSYLYERFRISALIYLGSRGGPALNRQGEVVGVLLGRHRALDAEKINFAVPSIYLRKLLTRTEELKPLLQGYQTISAETYFVWGFIKSELNDYEGAIENYSSAIQLKPEYVEAYNSRGIAKNQLGQYFDAIADHTKAIQLKPDHIEAYGNRGIARGNLRLYSAAITDFDIVILLKPNDDKAYYNRALAKSSLEKYAAAIADYDIAIRLEPNVADSYYYRGVAKKKLGQYFAAITDYDTALRLKPEYPEAYFSRGNAKSALKQFVSSISDYDIAIRLRPNFIEAYSNRGNAKNKLGKYFAAITDYDTVIRLKPNDAKTYNNRGTAKYSLKQYSAAIADFDIAIRLKPDYARAYYNRAVVKGDIGQTNGEEKDLLTALRLAKQTGNKSLQKTIEEILNLKAAIEKVLRGID